MNIFERLILLLVLFGLPVWVGAQSTAFTYQGNLTSGGSPANGSHDFEFALFDSLAGGSQVGSTNALNNIAVSDGTFSVQLNFGSQFPGANRFLEIRVRASGGGTFIALAPRQPVASSPYSIKSISAENAATAASAATATNALQLGGVAANQFVLTGDPRMSDARAPLPGNTNYIQNQNAAAQAASNFNISGTGTAEVFNAGTQFNLGGSRILSRAGTNNLFAGVSAGSSNTTGLANAFFGALSGQGNTTGTSNSFFGSSAGFANAGGNDNAFFGTSAGSQNTSGSFNTISGSFAGFANTTGAQNTFLGGSAGAANTIGSLNTAVGRSANFGANNLNNATALGSLARVDQSNALVLGSVSGINGATDTVNVGIGTTAPAERLHVAGNGLFAGNLTVSGTLNAALPTGSASYIQNTTTQQAAGNFNISGNGTVAGTLSGNVLDATTQYNIGGQKMISASGPHSGSSGTFGLSNTFVGESAGINTTPDPNLSLVFGKTNSFFGAQAGRLNTTGHSNSFFGVQAGLSNTSGHSNSFVGIRAGHANTSGQDNSFFGREAGFNNSTGNNNAFYGSFAGARNISGFQNTFVGMGAGNSNEGGSDNAFFGYQAGLSNVVGHQNSYFGRSAGATNTTGRLNTILGYRADVTVNNLTNANAVGAFASVNQNNSLVLGSILGVNGCLAATGCDNVNVGIGTVTPSQRLHVVGNAAFTGNLGIGTTAPTERLTIIGTGALGIAGAPATEIFNTTANVGWIQHVNNSGNWSLISTVGAVTRFFVTSAGNVGIGTTNPLDKLHVVGIVRVSSLGSAGSTALCLNTSSQIASCSSSLRYKSNVSSFTSGLDLISRLRPVSFRWKDSGVDDLGLVAEDVAKVEPLLTTTNDKGQIEGVKYDRIGVVLINAVRELQAQIEKQSETIEALKAIVCSREPNQDICSKP